MTNCGSKLARVSSKKQGPNYSFCTMSGLQKKSNVFLQPFNYNHPIQPYNRFTNLQTNFVHFWQFQFREKATCIFKTCVDYRKREPIICQYDSMWSGKGGCVVFVQVRCVPLKMIPKVSCLHQLRTQLKVKTEKKEKNVPCYIHGCKMCFAAVIISVVCVMKSSYSTLTRCETKT